MEEAAYLRRQLGDAFVYWILGDLDDELSPQQVDVALTISAMLRKGISDQPGIPIGLVAKSLVFYRAEWGTTSINHFRQHAAQAQPTSYARSGDQLLDSLIDLAIEGYGEMLLPTYPFDSDLDWGHYFRTSEGRNVVAAMRNEGGFLFAADDNAAESEAEGPFNDIHRSFEPLLYACRIINAAWGLAKLKASVPSLDELVDKLPDTLSGARSLLRGESTQIIAVSSFTGIRLPEGTEIVGNWGRIRAARAEDHPSLLKPMLERRTMTTTDAGEHVEITDAGDVIFEARIAMKMRINRDADQMSWSTSTREDIPGQVDRVRLAFALAIRRDAWPVLIPTWHKIIMPLIGNGPSSYSDPQSMASRVPILLSLDEIASWESWIDVVMAADLRQLNLAITRTLRAQTERRDRSDALIDAVIAWESLFGAITESTLRVSASLARLLHAAGAERELARSRYSKIYERRSKIVHGARTKTTAEQIDEDSRTAIYVVLEVIRVLLTKRSDLLPLESAERSMRILMQDHQFTAQEEIPSILPAGESPQETGS